MRSMVVLAALAGCGSDASVPDAAVPDDAALDASPDAFIMADADTRAAVVGLCANVAGPHGLTAEVTDWGGYIPSVTQTIPLGSVARFGYADGGTEHTIVSGKPGMADGLFASAPFDNHGTLTCIRFDAPGTYPIHCDRHPTSTEHGIITVAP